jgi:S-adenosylmethionine:tRNA ribosyltransferase-isomerase
VIPDSWHTDDFDYALPDELIAQTPIEPRDASRLMVVHRATGTIEHRIFRNIGDYLQPGDLLVANQSRVIPARLHGRKQDSGGAVEALLLTPRPDRGADCWEALVRPGRRIHEGQRLAFAAGLEATVLARTPTGGRVLQFTAPDGDVAAALARAGSVPLPPYIHTPLADPERYQTVYAREPGSAAAPTAGLHFTPELLGALQAQGVELTFVTLHIGLDTFRPLEAGALDAHKMHSEEFEVGPQAAAQINATRRAGGRIVAVGTTAVRVLESLSALQLPEGQGDIHPYRGRTELFIRPGHRFRLVDAMITNFHLPRSTLMVLVSAFAGRDLILRAYDEAVRHRYRFYSFGDAMLLT